MKNNIFLYIILSIVFCIALSGCSVETAKEHDERIASEQSIEIESTYESTDETHTTAEPIQSSTSDIITEIESDTEAVTDIVTTEAYDEQTSPSQKSESIMVKDEVSDEIIAETKAVTAETTKAPETVIEDSKISVNISIRCDEALENWDDLKPSAQNSSIVPPDGVILNTTKISINDGITAFSALNGICNASGIKLNFTGNEVRKTVYITGINGLYEKDCGSMSGWVYTINGERTSVGASGYTLCDGDVIEFSYTT